MSDENPFEAMMKAGQDWAKMINPALEKFTAGDFEGMFPTMSKDMMEQFMGKGLNPEGLDAKTKLLLTLQGLTIQGAIAEAQIKLTVRHAVAAGAT
ncbi:MAG: 4-carboxymuconolactone decarboxylase, partial [Paracoccaceae bacterium]